MMGRKAEVQNKLFYEAINLDRRIRKDYILRKIAQRIDFDFIYKEVQETYGNNGNVSVPPPVILKMMLLMRLPLRAGMPTKNISQPLILMLRLSGGAMEDQSFSTRSIEGLMKNMKLLPEFCTQLALNGHCGQFFQKHEELVFYPIT